MSNSTLLDTALIRDATDLVRLIGARVDLKKAGKDFQGLCPFHAERSPSFTVSANKQFYHCFGCGAHGDAIDWLMESQGDSFIEAASKLAHDAGIAIPDRPSQQTRMQMPLLEAMRCAHEHVRSALQGEGGAIARRYLSTRGVDHATVEALGIGYAGSQLPIRDEAAQVAAGLLKETDAGPRAFFLRRIMFPIRNRRGQVIAFGARTLLPDGKPKYLNSPETPLFSKSRALYGIYEAQRAIRQADHVIVVEGYFDAAVLHQHGIQNVVSGCGTAITEYQIKALLAIAKRITFAFDGDQAGRLAAERAIERLLPLVEDGSHVVFAFLPQGEDPDTFTRTHGVEAMRRVIDAAVPLSKALCQRYANGQDATLETRAELALEAGATLSLLKAAPILRELLAKEIGALLSVQIPTRHPKAIPAPPPQALKRPQASQIPQSAPQRGRVATPHPSPLVSQHVVAPVLRYLLAFPDTAAILPSGLQHQPVIAALLPFVQQHRDLDALSEAIAHDKALVVAVQQVVKAAIQRRDLTDADRVADDAGRAFASACAKLMRIEPPAA